MENYNFNPALAFARVAEDWIRYAENTKCNKWVIGLSGGKDSNIVCALAVEIFGKDNVLGVMMPNGTMKQEDIKNVEFLARTYEVDCIKVNIGRAYDEILEQMDNSNISISNDTRINLPPRLRMSTLYAVAQSWGGRPVNTSNLSERMVGYSTIWGDGCGAFAPIADLTTIEVIELGRWLGLPKELIEKPPADGLSGQTDEEKLGIKYAELDKYIRTGEYTDEEKRRKYHKLYSSSQFKRDMISVPAATMPWYNKFTFKTQLEKSNEFIKNLKLN